MFDTRYSALTFNKLAGEIGVRVICVDRYLNLLIP